jgi:hypothetical protein
MSAYGIYIKKLSFCFSVWSCNPVLNFNWSIVICLVIDYTGFGGSFYINITLVSGYKLAIFRLQL